MQRTLSLLVYSLVFAQQFSAELYCAAQPPVSEQKSIYERRKELDRNYFVFQRWSGTVSKIINDGELPSSELVSEATASFLPSNQFEILERAYVKREARYRELLHALLPFEIADRRSDGLENGRTREYVDRLYPLPIGWSQPSEEACEKAFREYTKFQLESEREWAEAVEEILSPEQFRDFIFLTSNGSSLFLRTPLLAEFLQLNEAQRKEVQRLCAALDSKILSIKSQIKKSDLPNADSVFITDQGFRRIYFKPYTALTPHQFYKAAKPLRLMGQDESWHAFRERVLSAKDSSSEILGPLIDDVIIVLDPL